LRGATNECRLFYLDLGDIAHTAPTVFVARHDDTQAGVGEFLAVAFVGDHCRLVAKVRRDLARGKDDGMPKLGTLGRVIDSSGLFEQCPSTPV
jgi:hypothetical protein